MKILLVEDEKNIRDVVKLNLELEDYEVITASNGRTALKHFHEQNFDMVLLDVMLPKVDGFQVCEQIRLANRTIPIMMLTAKDGALDRIAGLKKGADDYLVKPFNLEELLLRVQNLLRRTNEKVRSSTESYTFNNNKINFLTYEALGQRGGFSLTKKEIMLLKLLTNRKGEVVSRQQILQAVWGYGVYPSTRTIDNFILTFRKHFEIDPKFPKHFLSIRGVGYKFVNQV